MSDIADLMAKDPHDMTTQDIDGVIKYMRDKRQQFKAGAMVGKAPKVSEAAAKTAQGIDLKGLGL